MIILIIILIFEIYLLNKVLKYFILSPIYLYVLFSLISIILSLAYFYHFENKFSLFNLDKNISEEIFLNTIKLYILSLCSFLFGVIIFYDLSKRKTRTQFNKSYTKSLFIKYNTSKFINYIALSLFFIIIILYYITYGEGFFVRKHYLPDTNKLFTVLLKILNFIEIILLGLIYHRNKMLSTILFILTIVSSLTTGSRSIFIFSLFYFCLIFISSGNNLLNKVRFSIHIVINFVFLAFIMQLRTLESHGLIPYLENIGSSSNNFYRNIYFNIYYSFIYGVYVTIGTIRKAQLNWDIIFVNINPLPGRFVGWYNHAENMRINSYVPFSLHGRVFKTGTFFLLIYFFITGLIFSYFEKIIRNLLSNNKRIPAFLIIILLGLHIIYAFEYNMRAAIRYFYYAFFILLLRYLYRQIKKNLPNFKKE